jgi:hypothetical protein
MSAYQVRMLGQYLLLVKKSKSCRVAAEDFDLPPTQSANLFGGSGVNGKNILSAIFAPLR